MKCPYCNKDLGEKNDCITSTCYAFGKVFPKYDLYEKESSKDNESLNTTKEKLDNSNISLKLEEIEKNATNQKSIPEEDSTGTSTNAGLYILIAIIILLVIGFVFF
ncbi:hypothetical protein FDC58_00020 [Clostridium botulinum]|uniref:hypothetical protein n=1 Tax=unclassified Clostridium TaxID=2614128 RepID=UPI000506F1AA|nr:MULTISPECIES: hypothetical protein [unclassified Clostridium]AIY80132.1 hypothetical protein U728_2190 [Clostridium botulinum 202F]KAI3347483.1 hypothetical protein CIT17_04335 [Clostridium botulinum]KFX56703.1 hypothetical protein KU41_09715 [Clostridium botulinum]KFX59719.1 hypothetical protein KU40_01655 [Clostridium botulinum]KON14243.1 hypothetical protein ACP50_01665 [Clostridium botulinum]